MIAQKRTSPIRRLGRPRAPGGMGWVIPPPALRGASCPSVPGLLGRFLWGAAMILGLMAGFSTSQPQDLLAQDNILNSWERQFYGRWEGASALLHNGSFHFGKLTFGDLNGDDLPDVLLGKKDGTIAFFINRGKPNRPAWLLRQEKIQALVPKGKDGKGPALKVIQHGDHAAPALVDIDRDEDLDLFIGTGDGRLLFYRNVGNPLLPAFSLVTENFVTRNFGHNLTPVFADVDRNRTSDLFIGNQEGEVILLVNQGTPRRAAFCVDFPPDDALPDEDPPCRPVPSKILSIQLETHAAPALVDWDFDGDMDLFVGKSNGAIAYYENAGTPFKGEWRLLQKKFLSIDQGGFAGPAFMDVNGDTRPDLLIGSSTNNVSLYTNLDTDKIMDVWKVTGNLFNIQRFGPTARNTLVSSGDLDGDQDLDLMIGDRGGRVLWLVNEGSAKSPAWRLFNENVVGTERENSAPLLADLDRDGDLDLLVGGMDGRLWFLRNQGDTRNARFMLETTNFASIDVGNDSVPTMVDIDRDGDLDLFVGNRRGLVIYYRNEGGGPNPDFRLVSTKFGNVAVRLNAAPSFFDWNRDKKPDLVVGARDGLLVLDVNKSEEKSPDPKDWEQQGPSWGSFQTHGYSAPHFADFNGDGKPDLMAGDGDGNVRLWWNRGAALPPGMAEESASATAGEDRGLGQELAVAGIPPTPSTESASGLTALAESEPTPSQEVFTADQLLSEQPPQGPLTPVFILASRAFGDIQLAGPTSPAIGDVDGDGDLDLVIGTSKGELAFYRNDGDKEAPKWSKVTDALVDKKVGTTLSPFLHDLDGDGKTDLLLGNERGRVLFFRNTGKNPDAPFEWVEDALTGINVGRNATPAVIYLNDDPHSDLLVGNFSGKLFTYVRTGGAQSLNFKLNDRRFLAVDVGVAATPIVGDLNRDEIPELLIGSDQGKVIYFTKGDVGKKSPWGWSLGSDLLRGLKFPFVTRPMMADIDDDGDMDLFVGEEKGRIYFYRNDAVASGEAPAQ